MADVIEINDLEQLSHYRLVWNAQFADTPRASFFHTYDWLVEFWRRCGDQRRFRVLVIRACGSPIGVVPLCIQTERYQVGKLRVLTFPLSDWGAWYGPIGRNQSACMFMAMQHLRRTHRDWDLLELRWIDDQKNARSGVGRAMRAAGMTPHKKVYQQNSIVTMCRDWDAYLASRSSKWRHELRRQFRVVEQLGDIEFVRHRPDSAACGDGDPRWDLFDECLQVAKQSWQGQSTSGNTLSHEHVRGFLRDCHATAARVGMVDVGLLRINGKAVAFAYNYHFQGALFGLRIGYDASASRRGLGKALMGLLLRDSHRRGDRSYDLGPGDYDFKRRFRTELRPSYQFSHFPRLSLKPQGVRLTRWLKGRRDVEASNAATKTSTA